jgi:hypothetical protein
MQNSYLIFRHYGVFLKKFMSSYGVCFIHIFRFASIQIQCRFNDSNVINVADLKTWLLWILNFIKSIVGIFTSVDIKSFYVINSDVVRLFAYSSFLVFSEFEYVRISIDVPYWCEWMNIIVFSKNKIMEKVK